MQQPTRLLSGLQRLRSALATLPVVPAHTAGLQRACSVSSTTKCLAILLCALAAVASPARPFSNGASTVHLANPSSANAKKPISFEDFLHGEDLREAVFSPTGKHVAFTRSIPVDERQTSGFVDNSIVNERPFVAARSDGRSREIVCPDDALCSIARERAWSPDGQKLMLVKASGGYINLAYWSAETGEVKELVGRPDSLYPIFDWVGDFAAYATLSEKSRQEHSFMQVLSPLEEIWRRVWSGQTGHATVSSANPVFEASRPPQGALMLTNLANGRAIELGKGDYASVLASPDRQYVAAVRLDEPLADALGYQGRRGELQIFRVAANGAVLIRRFDKLDVDYQSLAWNAASNRLLVGGKYPDEPKARARLYEVDLRTSDMDGWRVIQVPKGGIFVDTRDRQGMGLLPIGWIGNHPAAVLGQPTEEAAAGDAESDYETLRYDVYVFKDEKAENLTSFSSGSVNHFLAPKNVDFALVVADGALWRVRAESAPVRLSPIGAPPVMAFAPDNRIPRPSIGTAYFSDRIDERVAVYTIGEARKPQRQVFDLKNKRFGPAHPRETFLAATPDLVATLLRVRENWVTRLVLREGQRERQLAIANSDLADRAVAPVERFTYTSGGQKLTGWFVMPPDARRRQPLPAIIWVYGGAIQNQDAPLQAQATMGLDPQYSGQLLASEGYVVIYPSLPIGPGATTDVMATLAEHTVAAVDALAARGVVDPGRVGVMGVSFGGYSTAAILAKRSDRFAAGIAMAGIYDWIDAYGALSQAQILTPDGRDQFPEEVVEQGQIRLGRPFWKNLEAYTRNSPIFHVEQIDSPLMMLQGDLDSAGTSLTGALRMYNALVRAGKKPVLVRYWGEGHHAGSEWAIRDQWSRITTWFDAYLKDIKSSPAAPYVKSASTGIEVAAP